MCLAIPGRLNSIDGAEGIIDYGGVQRRAELCLVPDAKVGDRVLVHAGFAIAVLDQKAGEELERLVRETQCFAPEIPAVKEPPPCVKPTPQDDSEDTYD